MYDSGFAVKVLSARLSLAAILRILVLSPYPGLAFRARKLPLLAVGRVAGHFLPLRLQTAGWKTSPSPKTQLDTNKTPETPVPYRTDK